MAWTNLLFRLLDSLSDIQIDGIHAPILLRRKTGKLPNSPSLPSARMRAGMDLLSNRGAARSPLVKKKSVNNHRT